MESVTWKAIKRQQITGHSWCNTVVLSKKLKVLICVIGISSTIYLLFNTTVYTSHGLIAFPVPARNMTSVWRTRKLERQGDSLELRTRESERQADSLEWRTRELERLGDLVQRRLEYIQNPADCDAAQKVLCNFSIRVGFGSLMHDGIACLIVAYATQRTLIIDSSDMRYTERGLESMFQPLSTTCNTVNNQTIIPRNNLANIGNLRIVSLTRHTQFVKRPPYLPFAIPEDLASNLTRVHENPSGWWIGQILKYLLRYNDSLRQFIEQSVETSDFDHPIVGIHVRRTDKEREARYHDLSDYMKHVDEWFDDYEKAHSPVRRKVFLASDDTHVIIRARKRYPLYTFVTNQDVSTFANNLKTRYSESSLRGLMLDVDMLSRCDYFVCTMSSSVGRLVYELMHVRYWDAPSRIKSLDVDYTFHRRFFPTPTRARMFYRRNKMFKMTKLFTNITNAGKSLVGADNKKLPVAMPTYPQVPIL